MGLVWFQEGADEGCEVRITELRTKEQRLIRDIHVPLYEYLLLHSTVKEVDDPLTRLNFGPHLVLRMECHVGVHERLRLVIGYIDIDRRSVVLTLTCRLDTIQLTTHHLALIHLLKLV